jgi:hypothetical protein
MYKRERRESDVRNVGGRFLISGDKEVVDTCSRKVKFRVPARDVELEIAAQCDHVTSQGKCLST